MSSKLNAVPLSPYWAESVTEVTQEIQRAAAALEKANRRRLGMLQAIESIYGSSEIDEIGLKVYIPEVNNESIEPPPSTRPAESGDHA